MPDVDRYITDEAVLQIHNGTSGYGSDARSALRAALPGILAQHRADVLHEAADRLGRAYVAGDRRMAAQGILRRLADEAVAE